MSQPAFDFPDDGVQLDEPFDPTYSVGELADAINQQFRRGFADGVWVRGEINGLARRGPHVYFSLIEHGDDGRAKIDVKLFAPTIRRLTPLLKKSRLDLTDGLQVRLHGVLDFWAQGGSLGLKMDDIDPRYTLGDIAQSRDAVLRRLVAGGLVDRNKRHELSPIPLRVGVATSVDSAAWADFRVALESSGYGFHLTVADTRVQGDGADRMVAGAIGTLARGAHRGLLDVIVVIRGGGARNELAVFDSEAIARTIAAVPVPVLTGLGHEIDRSIADEVAHTALTTPTACAGTIIERVATYATEVEMTWQAIVRHATADIDAATRRVAEVGTHIAAQTRSAVGRADDRLTARLERLDRIGPEALVRSRLRIDRSGERLVDRAMRTIERSTSQLEVVEARVGALDPAVQLARGWTITRTGDGRILRSAADVTSGDVVTTSLLDGEVTSVVDGVRIDHDTEGTHDPRPVPRSEGESDE